MLPAGRESVSKSQVASFQHESRFLGGSADLEIAEQERRRLCHLGYGTVENLLVVDRRPLEPTHLADVLECGSLDLLGWSCDRPVTQAFD